MVSPQPPIACFPKYEPASQNRDMRPKIGNKWGPAAEEELLAMALKVACIEPAAPYTLSESWPQIKAAVRGVGGPAALKMRMEAVSALSLSRAQLSCLRQVHEKQCFKVLVGHPGGPSTAILNVLGWLITLLGAADFARAPSCAASTRRLRLLRAVKADIDDAQQHVLTNPCVCDRTRKRFPSASALAEHKVQLAGRQERLRLKKKRGQAARP